MTRYLIRFDDGAASIVEANRVVSFEERANQYLAERSIDVLYADGEHVAALSQGYSKTYRLGFEMARGWWCSCRIQGECPHLMALKSVVGTTVESRRKAEVEAEAMKAKARLRSAMENEPEFVAQRARSDRVPALEAELRSQTLRLSELEADLAQKLSQHRLELMERDIVVNELQRELDRLRARTHVLPGRAGRPVPTAREAARAFVPRTPAATPAETAGAPQVSTMGWTDSAVPTLSHRNGHGREAETSGTEPAA